MQNSKLHRIENNLRVIDEAKAQCAFDRQITNSSHVFTVEDLMPYLTRGMSHDSNWFKITRFGERYDFTRLGAPSEARLGCKINYGDERIPKGAIVRMGTEGLEYILPTEPTRLYRWDGSVAPLTNR